MCSAYSPDSSERYAIDFPSGDHAGSRSTTAVVLVKLRMSPFSAGTVKISPRTPNTARAPVGEMSAERILLGSIFRKRSEEHTSELQSRLHLVCRLLLEKKKIPVSSPHEALHRPAPVL